ncbi:hypothetical protein L1049_015702 [Liquidambar formosana]|uniref:Auxin-responsive protein n=1 Tax=Liquidambar formosana TaxID=63359 RepID=A0AAP0WZZ2_LIQFO
MAFTASNHHSSGGSHTGASSDALYKELWNACAGPLVTVPREQERVYYFPQGHMEQLEASTHQGLDQQMPSFNLPSKILCKVVHVQLRGNLGATYSQQGGVSLGENGELRVGVRRLMRQPNNMPSSVISSHSMHLGVLATASHAIATGTLFSVFYKPRTSRSEFIVSVNKYLEARNHKLSVGMRFKMRFEGEEVPERRFSGTIVGVGDNTSSGWADSEWRSLKVQWDEPSSILRPERVSSWELEPLVAATPPNSQPAQRNKRARPPVLPSPTSDHSVLGMWKSPVESPSAFSYCDPQRGRESYPSPKYSCVTKANSLGFNGNCSLPAVSSNSMYWSSRVEPVTESFSPIVNKECGEKRQGTGNGYRLFGIQLLDNSNMEETSPVVTVSGTVGDDRPVPSLDAESDQHSEPSNRNQSDNPYLSCEPEKSCLRSPQESQSRQIRSCTKVHKQGIAVGRAVDLTRFDQYDDLLRKLEEMFDIEGELCGATKKWQVVYTDDEDDIMMVGDDPWHEFCSMVKKIFIYTAEEVKSLSPKIKLPVGEEIKPGKLTPNGAVGTEDQSSVVGSGC